MFLDPGQPGLGLFGPGDVQVVLPLPPGGEGLEGRYERRVAVETVLEFLDECRGRCRLDLEPGLLDVDGLDDVVPDGVGQAGDLGNRGELETASRAGVRPLVVEQVGRILRAGRP